jgi:hypothetical protein
MNWPDFVVNQEGAINLRDHVVDILTKVYGSKPWSKFIDNSVYGDMNSKTKGSGFRLPWSHKKSKHEACSGKGCGGCQQSGKITEGVYLPVMLYQGQEGIGPLKLAGKTDMLDGSISVELLKMVTVRTPRTDFVKIPPLPGKSPFSKAVMNKEVNNSELLAVLETFIRQNLDGQGDARITKVFKKSETEYCVSTYSRYCENIGREHGSNHIWFHVKENEGICQKCFCKCETVEERKKGYCRDFAGRRHKLTSQLVKLMFPKKNKVSEGIKKAILPNAVVNPTIHNLSNTLAIYTKGF